VGGEGDGDVLRWNLMDVVKPDDEAADQDDQADHQQEHHEDGAEEGLVMVMMLWLRW